MKLILATLLLSVTFADLISNESSQPLKCYTSNGWKQFDEFDSEKEHCSSRCYAANAFYNDGREMVKLGCDINDYENNLFNPLMNRIKKAEELGVDLSIVIGEKDMNNRPELDIFAYGSVDKSTIEKIKSKEKLSLSGFFSLNIDELGVMYLDSNGTIDLSNPFGSYSQSAKVCFGKPEICEDVNLGNSMSITWFWSKILIEREARIVVDQCEFKLSIKGDFGSVLDKIRGEEEFIADLEYSIWSDKSYLTLYYDGKTSTSKFRSLIEDMMYQYHTNSILEYLYAKASEIKVTICPDNKCFSASGCSKDLCNRLNIDYSDE